MGFAIHKEIKLVVYLPQYDQILLADNSKLIFTDVHDGNESYLVDCTIGKFQELVKKNHGVVLGEL